MHTVRLEQWPDTAANGDRLVWINISSSATDVINTAGEVMSWTRAQSTKTLYFDSQEAAELTIAVAKIRGDVK